MNAYALMLIFDLENYAKDVQKKLIAAGEPTVIRQLATPTSAAFQVLPIFYLDFNDGFQWMLTVRDSMQNSAGNEDFSPTTEARTIQAFLQQQRGWAAAHKS